MIFSHTVTVPINTTKLDPYEEKLSITRGTITSLSVYFPWGCAGLVGCQMLRLRSQLLPLSPNVWLTGNDFLHSYDYFYEITTEPYDITLRFYNEDDTYTHSPFVVIEMSRQQDTSQLSKFLRLFDK